ncbi:MULTISPECIES: IclR family transcriptional regulator [unclassified Nocardioides]|uniref:IclR family transcriptional regulator n=1 Tax=unclassified Nocardioides TaxID=2615069 RepID=UPI00114FDFE3|nr:MULTISPECIES: IclR family transcriptional regulator [unclassified Nocardioides]TQK69058.1 IclR family transcriptional regulator [Nocardioides sp. SLBN-35]WGY01634.1 IclR family transcriptional regulator [Nocardioides sp. QY071]
MQKPEKSREVPAYMVSSVDRALRLIQMLRDHGELRLRTAARDLDVAESTVHRLMSMLVFHGFAVQDESKAYRPGPALGVGPVGLSWTRQLRDVAVPHLELLSNRTGETANLVVRVGTKIHFLFSQEGNRTLRIVSRMGAVLPASTSAGGKALLADLPDDGLRQLYQSPGATAMGDALSDRQLGSLLREIRACRRNGFATTNQQTEKGVSAVAVPLRDGTGRAIASMSISAPSARFAELLAPESIQLIMASQHDLQMDVAALGL